MPFVKGMCAEAAYSATQKNAGLVGRFGNLNIVFEAAKTRSDKKLVLTSSSYSCGE